MLFKIQLLLALCFLLIACHDNVHPALSDIEMNDSLDAIHLRYENSHNGITAAATLFSTQPRKDIDAVLHYYRYLSDCYSDSGNYAMQLAYADSTLLIVNKPEADDLYRKEKAIADISKAHALY